jgi:hypothetical protein
MHSIVSQIRVLTALALFAMPVAAQEPAANAPASATLRVRGPTDCLSSAMLERQVQRRSRRLVFVASAPDVPHVEVEVRRTSGHSLSVQLWISWPDGRRSERGLAANSCEEAGSAAAFLIALTFDPAAALRTPADNPAAPGSGSREDSARGPNETAPSPRTTGDQIGTTPTPPVTSDETLAEAANSNPQAIPTDAQPAPSGAESEEPAPSPFEVEHVGLGLGVQLTSGVAPNVMFGVGLQAILAFYGRGVWQPALQLSAAHAWTSGLREPGGVADFQLSTARVDLCPAGLQTGPFAARACLTSALGSLNAQGSQSFTPRTSARGWFDLGASLLLSAALGPVLELNAGASLVAPLRRDQYAFRPDTFHRAAAPCWEGHLGVGVRFP